MSKQCNLRSCWRGTRDHGGQADRREEMGEDALGSTTTGSSRKSTTGSAATHRWSEPALVAVVQTPRFLSVLAAQRPPSAAWILPRQLGPHSAGRGRTAAGEKMVGIGPSSPSPALPHRWPLLLFASQQQHRGVQLFEKMDLRRFACTDEVQLPTITIFQIIRLLHEKC